MSWRWGTPLRPLTGLAVLRTFLLGRTFFVPGQILKRGQMKPGGLQGWTPSYAWLRGEGDTVPLVRGVTFGGLGGVLC